jgi:hypothetical protein
VTDAELAELKDFLLHRWRHTDGEVSEALSKLLAEVDRLRALVPLAPPASPSQKPPK